MSYVKTRSILWDYPYFGLPVTLPIGFKARVLLWPAIYLPAHGEPKGHVWCSPAVG